MIGTDDFDLELADLLRRPDVWHEPAAPARTPAGIAAMETLSARLAVEDEAAAELLRDIEKTPVAWWRTAIVKSPVARSAGIVRQLLEQMRRVIPTSPLNALECTAIAVDLSNELGVSDHPCDFAISLRADALRDHAFMLSFLGRTHEALAALDRAETLLRQLPVPDFHLARTKLVRATIYVVIERRPEAIALAHEAGETFLAYGERSRYVDARSTEASMLHEHGATREALGIWESISNDPALADATRVAIVHNMGLAHRELGNAARSVELITQAIAEYELLGMETQATYARWGLASTLVSAGRLAESIALFDDAWKTFERLGGAP